MTRKNRRESLRESLSSAVRPPEPSPKLDEILGRYATAQPMLGRPAAARSEILTPAQETKPSTPPSTGTTTPTSPPAVAPQRDFQRVANSITRVAVPGGMFTGKAKQLYDCLYSLTRGAIVPSMSVRIAKTELMEKADIGSKVTLDQNIKRLELVGLISVVTIGGIQGGNQYTVHLPEEATILANTPPSTGTSPPTSPSPPSGVQKVGPLPLPETTPPSMGVNVDLTNTWGDVKTLIKTNTESDDDEALAPLLAQISRAVKEITGREPSKAEAERWRELGELLVTELKIAAGRTTVSNVPAFFTEHLRRRLWKKEKRQLEEEGKSTVGNQGGSKIDASKCPDCFGTGMWYPEGFDKGVARCRHERLAPEAG